MSTEEKDSTGAPSWLASQTAPDTIALVAVDAMAVVAWAFWRVTRP